jgi:uncharacterized protein YbcI
MSLLNKPISGAVDDLRQQITRRLDQLGFRVRNFRIAPNQESIVLHGRVRTDYCKQMIQQIAEAASAFEQLRTGHVPTAVTVVLSEDTIVITLRGGLSEIEKALAQRREGAAQVQGFHRLLFTSSADSLWREIKRITGVDVLEAAAEVDSATGAILHVFTTGTIVQVFLLSHPLPAETWSSSVLQQPPRS